MTRNTIPAAIIVAATWLAAPAMAETYAGPGFSGEAHLAEPGKPMQKMGTVNVDTHGFRLDMVAQGQHVISLLYWTDPTTVVLMPDQGMFMELPPEQSGWSEFENRPCSGFEGAKKLGSESFDGRDTEKWRCTGPTNTPQGQTPSDATVWYDKSLKFEVRVEEDNGNRFEIRNINTGRQDAALFEIPNGYSKFDLDAMMQQMMQQQQSQ